METQHVDILLVDDRIENIYALEAVLKSPDYNLIRANSGEEALKYLLNNDCALILMDVQMPGMDGFETASYIKKSPRSASIPIIFITAINKDERFVYEGYKSGAVDYIFKPFEAEILKSKVDVFVELYRSKEEIKRQAQLLHLQDLEERERALAQLELKGLRREQAVQKKYRDLVEGIDHGIIWASSNADLKLHFISSTSEKILGYPLDNWLENESSFLDHIPEDDRERFVEVLGRIKEDADQSLEHRMIKANGKEAWFHTGLKLAEANNNGEFEIRGLSVEITHIKETENALKESEERALFIAEASFILSESLQFESCISTLSELTVPRYADWISIDILEENQFFHSTVVTHKHSRKISFSHHQNKFEVAAKSGPSKVMQNGKTERHRVFHDTEIANICQNDEGAKHLSCLGAKNAVVIPLQLRGKKIGAMTLVSSNSRRVYNSSDVHMFETLALRVSMAIDNANLYKQAQSAVRARDEFLSIASHELKTPLTPLRLHLQSLVRTLKTGSLNELNPVKIKKIIDTSDKQIHRLTQLIDNLLDISRINIGQLDLNLQTLNLSDFVKEITDRYTEELEMAGSVLQLNIEPNIVGQWDKFRVEQIVVNLITNAIKYGNSKPIFVSVEKSGDLARIIVQDNGIGIDEKDHHRIFERFERAVSPYNFKGLGLGLFIVKQLTELHYGDIRVESTAGEGSKFIVEIPTTLSEQQTSLQQA